MTTNTEALRPQFEAAYAKAYPISTKFTRYMFERDGYDGQYIKVQVQTAWTLYCAAIASVPAHSKVTDDMRNAVRWAPSSAYWSEKLKEFFGPDAREGICALEKQVRDALERAAPAQPVRHYDWVHSTVHTNSGTFEQAPVAHLGGALEHVPGMSLRDYFAGQALAGISSHVAGAKRIGWETQAEADARWSYAHADAMLKARSA